MAHNWHSSHRPKDPPGWANTRRAIIERARGICQYPECTYPGSQVDHIVNLASGGTHDPDNLWLLCDWHHKRKTADEANAARKLKRTLEPIRETRPKPNHPGLIG